MKSARALRAFISLLLVPALVFTLLPAGANAGNCNHPHPEEYGQSVACSEKTDNGNGTHTRVLTNCIVYRCPDCGQTWEVWGAEYGRITEPHSFSGETCQICGAPEWYDITVTAAPETPAPTAVPACPAGGQLVPDSGIRRMTEAECWNWTYDALGFICHEILARHGFVFDPYGSYAWYFCAQPWYRPIPTWNNEDVYALISDTEWYNINLIKGVRRQMAERGTGNPWGRQAPQPAAYRRTPVSH